LSDFLANLNAEQLDVFQEIGNIGSGNAVTALATMLDREIDMSVPKAQIVPFNKIVNVLNGPESLMVGILLGMVGDMNGYVLLAMTPDEAFELASLAFGERREPPLVLNSETVDEMDRSALMEVGNILVGSYLSALAELTGMNLQATPPNLAIDMAGAIISTVAIEFSQFGDNVLFLETTFKSQGSNIAGHFFLIPDDASFQALLDALGIA